MRPVVLALCSLCAMGCNAVLGLDERPLNDDAAIEETSAADDTAIAVDVSETTIDDTLDDSDSTLDTFVADSTEPDVRPPDTSLPDTTMPDATSGGVLTVGSEMVAATTINLTTEGTLDWAHWGHTTPTSFNHRVGSSLIGKGTTTGSIYDYSMYTTKFSWTDGTPTVSATSEHGLAALSTDEGFTVDVFASATTIRTLRIYTVWSRCSGSVTATLSDGSAPAYSGMGPVATSAAQYVALTFAFRSTATGAKLTVKMLKGPPAGSGVTSLSLLAASLR
jgi:hypothetical protein